MRQLLAVLVVLSIAGAFVAGYWPQRQQLARARAETVQLRRRLAEARALLAAAEAKARLGRLFGQYLALHDAVLAADYAEAQALSSPFFNAVRDEAEKTGDAAARTALDAALMRRDTVTAGIARGESSVRDTLVPIARELRRALGYTVRPSSRLSRPRRERDLGAALARCGPRSPAARARAPPSAGGPPAGRSSRGRARIEGAPPRRSPPRSPRTAAYIAEDTQARCAGKRRPARPRASGKDRRAAEAAEGVDEHGAPRRRATAGRAGRPPP